MGLVLITCNQRAGHIALDKQVDEERSSHKEGDHWNAK